MAQLIIDTHKIDPVALSLILGELVCSDGGRLWPAYNGEELDWDISKYLTLEEEKNGFPKMRLVIRMMALVRPGKLNQERKVFSNNPCSYYNYDKCLSIIEEELGSSKHDVSDEVSVDDSMPWSAITEVES